MSLDRLIKLAKKTGDRLIVHNPTDETDVVIMGIDEYEMLLDAKPDDVFGSATDVRGLSERELLDQINRDISIWRANDKLESEHESFDFAQDKKERFDSEESKSDWHGVGSVLEDNDFEGYIPNFEPSFAEATAGKEDVIDFAELQKTVEKEEIKEIILTDLPQAENQSIGLISDDEPVFYEEPV